MNQLSLPKFIRLIIKSHLSSKYHLYPDCIVLINHERILFTAKTTSTKVIDFKIPNIDQLAISKLSHINISKIDLTPINTQKLIQDQIKINDQKNTLKSIDYIDHNHLSLSSIIFTIIIILLVISLAMYSYYRRNSLKIKLIEFLNKDIVTKENTPA